MMIGIRFHPSDYWYALKKIEADRVGIIKVGRKRRRRRRRRRARHWGLMMVVMVENFQATLLSMMMTMMVA